LWLYNGLKSKGAACVIKGRHLCMEIRGVKKETITTTTALQGVFFQPEVRAEFLAAVRGG
jgi:GTP cyclohydrolase I